MAGLPPMGSLFDAQMTELLNREDFRKDFEIYEGAYHQTFAEMGLQENLLKGIADFGYVEPSPVQQGIVPFGKRGLNVIQQAVSGTGKAATFCCGILQQLNYSLLECQALVVVPTRDRAKQNAAVMRALGVHLDVKVHECIGVTSVNEDVPLVLNGFHVAVGTPGGVSDVLDNLSLSIANIKMVVLDEADEMLSTGFKDKINDIFFYLPKEFQAGVFSATMPPEVVEIARKFMKEPRVIIPRLMILPRKASDDSSS